MVIVVPAEDDRRICQPYVGNPCYDQCEQYEQEEEVSENDAENETDKGDEFLATRNVVQRPSS